MVNDNQQPSELDRIAEKFSAAIRAGDNPSVREFLSRYPDPSGELEKLLRSIELLEGIKSPQETETRSKCSIPEQLGDYRIVREIGRGGMGIVLEGIHLALSRRVAIKVFTGSILNQKQQLARFKQEARAAARLRHRHIVPVYGVGSTQELHYFVMDLIPGRSIKQELNTLRGIATLAQTTLAGVSASDTVDTEFDSEAKIAKEQTAEPAFLSTKSRLSYGDKSYFVWAARTIADVCDALHYAQQNGVLHRDIKPANLLLDENRRVLIADFGLAKMGEQQDFTRTGDVVGTPQYLPPESIKGHYDQRSEVYAVGLTLFELLTLEPAVAGKNTADVLRNALEGVKQVPRDSRLSSVPCDLETITYKALSLEPEKRYPSMEDMKLDLECFLSSRPISARRTSSVEKMWRWVKRQPVVASLSAVVFGLLTLLGVVASVGYFQTSQALSVAESEQAKTKRALQEASESQRLLELEQVQAESNLQAAIEIFEEIIKSISDRGVNVGEELLGEFSSEVVTNVTPQDAVLLERLLKFFDQFSSDNKGRLQVEAALAARRVADIYVSLGNLGDAADAYEEALKRYQKLMYARETGQSNQVYLAEVLQVLNAQALIAGRRGQPWKNEEIYTEVLKLLPETTPVDSPIQALAFARAFRLYASFGMRSGIDGLQPKSPRGFKPRLTKFLRDSRDMAAINHSLEILDELEESGFENLDTRLEVIRSYRCRSEILERTGKRREARDSTNEALLTLDKELKKFPQEEVLIYELVAVLMRGEAMGFGQLPRAEKARMLAADLRRNSPNAASALVLEARAIENLGKVNERLENYGEAQDNYSEAANIFGEVIAKFPSQFVFRLLQTQAMEGLARTIAFQGEHSKAEKILEQAIRRIQPRGPRRESAQVSRMHIQRLQSEIDRLQRMPAN